MSVTQTPAIAGLVAVRRTVRAPGETGLSLFARLAGTPHAFLLESLGPSGAPCGPAVVGDEPLALLTATGDRIETTIANETHHTQGDPVEALRALMRALAPAPAAELPRYVGAVGYFGYDVVRHIERLPQVAAPGLPMPEAYWVVPGAIAVLDADSLELVALGATEAAATARLERLHARLSAPVPAAAPAPGGLAPEFVEGLGEAAFCERVEVLKEHIRAGDIFQGVLSQRFEVETPVAPLEIYRALRAINPSPHMFVLNQPGAVVVGASPERLCRVRDGELAVRPIAGTRPRGATPAEDAAHEADLLADPKELAEHVMLVDLGRNDVGRVAAIGSVTVADAMVVERYSHVMHLVSGVTGRLAAGRDAFDAFRATFPAGTLSGAPKVMAMTLIERLEPVRRTLYGGAVGYFGFGGDAELAIAIRTLVALGDRKVFQTGAGIVYDSDARREHQETLAKARALREAVMRAHTGHSAAHHEE